MSKVWKEVEAWTEKGDRANENYGKISSALSMGLHTWRKIVLNSLE